MTAARRRATSGGVTRFRRLFLDHRTLSAWLIALALLMKVAVPAGFMPVIAGGTVTIAICGGTQPADPAMRMAMPGMAQHQDRSGHDDAGHSGRDMPCAFSGLAMPSLAAVDPVLLALAIAFIVAVAFRVVAPGLVRAPAFLRPPLRGPPTPA
jgi:hypothetical protein